MIQEIALFINLFLLKGNPDFIGIQIHNQEKYINIVLIKSEELKKKKLDLKNGTYVQVIKEEK